LLDSSDLSGQTLVIRPQTQTFETLFIDSNFGSRKEMGKTFLFLGLFELSFDFFPTFFFQDIKNVQSNVNTSWHPQLLQSIWSIIIQ